MNIDNHEQIKDEKNKKILKKTTKKLFSLEKKIYIYKSIDKVIKYR